MAGVEDRARRRRGSPRRWPGGWPRPAPGPRIARRDDRAPARLLRRRDSRVAGSLKSPVRTRTPRRGPVPVPVRRCRARSRADVLGWRAWPMPALLRVSPARAVSMIHAGRHRCRAGAAGPRPGVGPRPRSRARRASTPSSAACLTSVPGPVVRKMLAALTVTFDRGRAESFRPSAASERGLPAGVARPGRRRPARTDQAGPGQPAVEMITDSFDDGGAADHQHGPIRELRSPRVVRLADPRPAGP